MSLEIEELKIVLSTNITNKKMDQIIFKRSMIYHPELKEQQLGLNEYPYFTFDVEYPESLLRLMIWPDRLNFFFNKNKFTEILNAVAQENILSKEDVDYESKRNKMIKHNIMFTLEILFPTKFPVVNNLTTSYDYIMGKYPVDLTIVNPFVPKHYSYLKLENNIYTFEKVVWMNDVYNHPLYKRLLEAYHTFDLWANDEKKNALKLLNGDINKIYGEMTTILNDFIDLINNMTLRSSTQKLGFTTTFQNEKLSKIIKFILLIEKYQQKSVTILTKFNDMKNTKLRLVIRNLKTDIHNKIQIELNDKLKGSIDTQISSIDIELIKYKNLCLAIIDALNGLPTSITTDRNKEFNLPILPSNATARSTTPAKRNTLKVTARNEVKRGPLDIPILTKIDDLLINVKKYDIGPRIIKYENIYNLYTNPYSWADIQKANPPHPREYINFMHILLNEYRRPQRESTNVVLQDIIKCENEKSVSDFFRIFGNLYKYMRNRRSVNKEDAKEMFDNFVNIGINYINTSATKEQGPRREVYVMTNFIDGELNDANISSYYCPYMSDRLGNNFEYLMRKSQMVAANANDLFVTTNRMMSSLNKLKSPPAITPVNMNDPTTSNIKSAEETDKSNTLFLQYIVNDPNIASAIQEFNNYPNQNVQNNPVITDTNLLEYLNNNNKEMYNIITEWASNEYKRNDSLLEKMMQLKSKYNGNAEVLANKKKLFNISAAELNRLNVETTLNKLYIAIMEKLEKHEIGKQTLNIGAVTVGGNSRMTIYRKHNATNTVNKKNRHNTTRKNI